VQAGCEARLSSEPPIIWAIFGCPKGRLDDRECNALALVDVHIWLLLFANDLVLTLESQVGLQQQLDALHQFCVERGLTVNMKKIKVMMFNSVDPC
jgi:hypothetical protein